MRVNTARATIHTHEGAPAKRINPYQQLRRTVMSCLLWEDQFYEDGVSIADRIKALVPQVDAIDVAALAVEARTEMKLRHVPLLLARELVRHPNRKGVKVGQTIADVIQRADELAEFLAIYWMDGKTPLAKQVKIGLSRAFRKFDAYQLAKYNRKDAVKLRDVLFLCHAKPKDKAQERTWKQLVDDTLPTPDTWETNLSGGEDKGQTFERLLRDKKLGYMALLRNLRNMEESGVDRQLVKQSIADGAFKSKALPFRFISAAKHAPGFSADLDKAMQVTLQNMTNIPGRTVVVVDCSASMDSRVSLKSEISRYDAAVALAILCVGICDDVRVVAYGTNCIEVPARAGLGLYDALNSVRRQVGWSTQLGKAAKFAANIGYDRVIVITDEQSHDKVPDPKGKGYVVNIASYENGVGYGAWTHIDGFSENTIRFIQELEGV